MGEIPESIRYSLEHSKAEYKQLGKSGLRVSVPILGAMSFGDPQWQPWVLDSEKSLPILKAAYERGVNTWDTANVYSSGVSEEIIGKAIKKYNLPRHKLIILTKCNGPVGEEPKIRGVAIMKELAQSRDYINQFGLSRQAIFNAVDASLARLQTSYIDLFQIHRFDPSVPIEETMEALHDLVKSGKVRYIGASSMWAFQFVMMQNCAEKHGWTKFVSMQNHYSLMYREEEREMNKYCDLTGVGLIPWGPVARGHLARPFSTQNPTARSAVEQRNTTLADQAASPIHYPPAITSADEEIINRVEKLAKKKGWAMSHVALAWISKRVSSPIVGFSSVERMDEALAARGKVLTEEEETFLEEPYVDRAVSGHR